MEFVLGNIYRIAYGTGYSGNPAEELGIGKLEKFIYDDANKLVGLHFVDRYGTIIKAPTKIDYYDSYGLSYNEELNLEPIPQDILDDYHRYFPTPEEVKVKEEEEIDRGILDFTHFIKQWEIINKFMNIFYPKLKKEKKELEEKYHDLEDKYARLQEDFVDLEDTHQELLAKFNKIRNIVNEED